jgi:hypothetical protein
VAFARGFELGGANTIEGRAGVGNVAHHGLALCVEP